jgi:hypothetical protein
MDDHVILLLQFDSRVSSRIWAQFTSTSDAIEEIIRMFEDDLRNNRLKVGNKLSYPITDLHQYVDNLHEACCLTLDHSTNKYTPHSTDWLKQQMVIFFTQKTDS